MAWYKNLDKMARAAGTAESWHGSENIAAAGATMDEWRGLSGLDFTVTKTPMFIQVNGEFRELEDSYCIAREDNYSRLGMFTGRYQPVQPKQIADFFSDFILADDRFAMDTMGSVRGGKVIWALAKFRDDMDVLGSKHNMHALLATSYDGTMATRGGACATRVVCRNTLQAAAYEGSIISIKHNAEFGHVAQTKALAQMAEIAKGFDQYREMAEALHKIKLSAEKTHAFLGELVGVKADAEVDEISGRKRGIVADLITSLDVTLSEPGTDEFTAWTALNAVTRYVDHDRATKRTNLLESPEQSRLASAQFGSGAALKATAVDKLFALA